MIDLRLTVNGTQQVDQRLDLMARHLSDFSPAFQDIKNAFVRLMRAEFDSQGAHGGYAWAPLSSKYAAWKAKHYPGRRILERTGDLRRDLTSRLQTNVGPRRLIMWSDSTIAGLHQGGTSNMPARKIVAIPRAEKRDWVRFLQRYVMANR